MKILHPLCFVAILACASLIATAAEPAQPAQITTVSTPQTPVSAGRDPDKIPATDTIITQVIPLQYQTGGNLLATLSPFVPADALIAATPNAIVITDRASVIKRLVQIIALLDVQPGGDNVLDMVRLQNADAAEAARLINAALNPQR